MILRITLVIIILGIAYLSLTPSETITVGNDKLGHFIAYGILMLNAGLLTYHKKILFAFGIILSLMYGALMEIGQYFVPGRFLSGYDMLANAGGVAAGAIITALFYKSMRRILSKFGLMNS